MIAIRTPKIQCSRAQLTQERPDADWRPSRVEPYLWVAVARGIQIHLRCPRSLPPYTPHRARPPCAPVM